MGLLMAVVNNLPITLKSNKLKTLKSKGKYLCGHVDNKAANTYI